MEGSSSAASTYISASSLPLPSLSTLTGTVRPETAAGLIESGFRDLKRANRRLLHTSGGSRVLSLEKPPEEQVSSLKDAAAKQLGSLDRAPGSPYQRVLSPAQRDAIKQEMFNKLQQLASSIRESAQQAQAAQQAAASAVAAAAASDGTGIPRHLTQQQPSRPGTSVPLKDLTMPRPSSKMARMRGLPGSLSASWSGPNGGGDHSLPAGGVPGFNSRPGSRLGTPAAMSRLRQSLPAMPASPGSGGGGRPDVWTNTDQGAGTGAGPWVGAKPGTPLTGAQLQQQLNQANHQLVQEIKQAAVIARAQTAPPRNNPRTIAAMQNAWGNLALAQSLAGAGGSVEQGGRGTRSRLGTAAGHHGGNLEDFNVTRGLVYSVFDELDKFDTGKLTYSTFEDAAVLIGMHGETARKLFKSLDPAGRGYITVKDWGSHDYERQINNFARLYIQQTRGSSGRPKNVREVKSVYMALQMAMTKLQLKNNGRSISYDRLADAFKFIDSDNSGNIDSQELMDAFNAMGIYVTGDVVEEALSAFDRDGSGSISYREFIRTMFPTLGQAVGPAGGER